MYSAFFMKQTAAGDGKDLEDGQVCSLMYVAWCIQWNCPNFLIQEEAIVRMKQKVEGLEEKIKGLEEQMEGLKSEVSVLDKYLSTVVCV